MGVYDLIHMPMCSYLGKLHNPNTNCRFIGAANADAARIEHAYCIHNTTQHTYILCVHPTLAAIIKKMRIYKNQERKRVNCEMGNCISCS